VHLALIVAGLLAAAVAGLVVVGSLGAPRTPVPVAAATATPSPTPSPSPTASPSPRPTPTPEPTPTPPPRAVAAVTNGAWIPWAERERATRRPITVMVDDHPDARPQSGLSTADVVYQAPAEFGIPRYMAVYQTTDAPSIGPVRSTRHYFAAWATEWRSIHAHVGGAPDGLGFVHRFDGELVWDADEYRWSGTFTRIRARVAPHNTYTSTERLRALGKRLGAPATGEVTSSPWAFTSELPRAERPVGSSLVIPMRYNRISYDYDPATNRYPRTVSGDGRQVDAGSRQRIAPANVVVLFMKVSRLADNRPGSTNERLGRLEIAYRGSGRALVLRNGEVIAARWSKADDRSSTLVTYADGRRQGQPVGLVRGQIFVQVVPNDLAITIRAGRLPGVSDSIR
jgi:hypothetical protein